MIDDRSYVYRRNMCFLRIRYKVHDSDTVDLVDYGIITPPKLLKCTLGQRVNVYLGIPHTTISVEHDAMSISPTLCGLSSDLVSSDSETMYGSVASCHATMAVAWNLKSFLKSPAISLTIADTAVVPATAPRCL